jgi:hypothetical protein
MKKLHVVAIALLLGLAAIAGLVAVTRTAGIGAAARARVTDGTILARTKQLDRIERASRLALKDRPPALPAVPTVSRGGPAGQQVIYRRPSPVVVLAHASGSREHEDEHESEGDDD